VIEEKKPYYAFEEIEKNFSGKGRKTASQKKHGRLLFRLVNFFHAESVLQIGISEEIRTAYLSAASKHLLVIDDGRLPAVDKALSDLQAVDFIFLNVSDNPELSRQLFERCIAHVHKQTVLVVDGIHKKKMRPCWQEIVKRNDIPVTIDLCTLGLVFFNRNMYKKNYKLFF
jgi:predicted O-methyltransferase YrrM